MPLFVLLFGCHCVVVVVVVVAVVSLTVCDLTVNTIQSQVK